MQLTQRIRVFPTEEQEEILWKLSDICRRLYNEMLFERIQCWENDYDLTWMDQQNRLPKLKKQRTELKMVYSKVLQMVVRNVDKDFKSFLAVRGKDQKTSYPRFKGKKYFATLLFNQSGFKVEKRYIRISHKYNDTPLKFKIPDRFVFENMYQVIIYRKGSDFFISIVYERETKKYQDNGKYQAIDIGITNIVTAVNSNGKFLQIKNRRPDKYWQKRIQQLQSRRDHCRKHSRKWHRLNKNFKRMKRKCANQTKDFQHKLSRKVVENTKANTIIVGKLDVKSMSKRKKGKQNHRGVRGLNRAIQNTGTMGRFVSFLTYKAEIVGKKVVKISERNTTRICCVCGVKKDRHLSERIIECDCGNRIDRDMNSAVNIMDRFLSQNAMWTSYQQFADNLRQTGLDISSRYSQEAPRAEKE